MPDQDAHTTTSETPDQPGQTYRVGTHYGIHVYAQDRPVATFHDADEARAAVDALNDVSTTAAAHDTLVTGVHSLLAVFENLARIYGAIEMDTAEDRDLHRRHMVLAQSAVEHVGSLVGYLPRCPAVPADPDAAATYEHSVDVVARALSPHAFIGEARWSVQDARSRAANLLFNTDVVQAFATMNPSTADGDLST